MIRATTSREVITFRQIHITELPPALKVLRLTGRSMEELKNDHDLILTSQEKLIPNKFDIVLDPGHHWTDL